VTGPVAAPAGAPLKPRMAEDEPRPESVDPQAASGLVSMPRLALLGVGSVALVGALVLPWLTTALGVTSGAGQLHVRLPGWYWLDAVTFQDILGVALALAAIGWVLQGRPSRAERPAWRNHASAWFRAAGALAALAGLGFLLQLLVSDARAGLALHADQADMTLLTSQLTYRLPQPQVTALAFVPLGASQALVFSALRMGWYLTVLAALLLTLAPAGRRRGHAPPTNLLMRWGPAFVVSLLALPFVLGLLRAGAADVAASDADGLAAAADYPSAAARYADALSLNPDLAFDPAVLAGQGRARLQSGLASPAAGSFALALDQAAAQQDAAAMATLGRAIAADPGNPVFSRTLVQVAVAFALTGHTPLALQGGPTPVPGSVLALFTRGQLEVQAGELTQAVSDLKLAVSLTASTEIRSAALTDMSIAQQREGDVIAARRTLQAALAADPGGYNVVARALAAGLYSGARP